MPTLVVHLLVALGLCPPGCAPAVAASLPAAEATHGASPDGAARGAPAATAVWPAPAATDSFPVEVRVEGIRGEMRSNVLASLRLARDARERRVLSRGEVERLHMRSPDQIRRALEPFGHYRPTVEGELLAEGGRWRVTYRVQPGAVVSVRGLDLRISGEGRHDPGLAEAADAFPLGPGAPFRHPAYEQAKRRLQAVAVERGYLDATFVHGRVEVDPEPGEAHVALELDTGDRHRFGPVRFAGSDLDPAFLDGFVRFRVGDPVSTPVLLEFQNALQATGLFSSVEVELRRGEAVGREVPVEVRLTHRPRRRYDAGLGFGTDTGPRAVLAGELRRLNRSGHGLLGELRTSTIQNGVNLSYVIPLPGAAGNRIDLTGGILDERTLDVRSTRAALGMRWQRGRGSWRETWLVDLQRERSGEGDALRTGTTLLPSVHWARTEVDDPVHALRGHRIRLEVAGAHRSVLSDVSFAKASLRAGGIVSPWEGGRLLVRGEVGAAVVDEVAELPVSFRFYAGGDRSVRGYAYRSLSPRSAEGTPLGGRYLLVLSTEVEQMLWRSWGIAAFIDAGNASADWPVGPRVGTGAGIRWRSPFGMVRVDGAAAVSESGPPWRLHLSVGPSL